MRNVHERIATIFGLGYFPVASGTAGSLAGLVLCLLLHRNVFIYILTFIILFVAGVITSNKVESESRIQDPSHVIIDEFACIFIVFLFIPLSFPIVAIGFGLYRVIDIAKLPPMGLLEKLKGGWGIMLDDLLAAVYTNIILHILIFAQAKFLG
jgi:phosphatidylglycerophosphatase A